MKTLTAGSGRPLVALHGNFASCAWFADLLARPPAGWAVLAPDLPGFAGSAASLPVTIAGFAQAVEALLDDRGVRGAALLGHGLGASVALELAARRPAAYAGLVLCAGAPPGGLRTPEENYPVLELLRTSPPVARSVLSALFPSGAPENFEQLVTDAARMAPELYSGNARALEAFSVRGRVPDLPALVLGGELDALVTPDMTRALGRDLGVTARVLAGRGHGFVQEDPAGFLAHLQGFLETLPPGVEHVTLPGTAGVTPGADPRAR